MAHAAKIIAALPKGNDETEGPSQFTVPGGGKITFAFWIPLG